MKHALILMLITLASANMALAGSGNGGSGQEGHGGETVDIDKRPRLRDLVDKTVCMWVTGTDFARQTPRFEKVLEAIESVHWYLAYAIREELERVSFCPSKAALKQLPTDDQDGLTIYEVESRQAAIRLNDMVFLDYGIFKSLPQEDRAYLILHEITHSFIPLDAKRRPSKVRNFVYAVFQHEKSPLSAERFGLQISRNDLQIAPVTAGTLDKYRQYIEVALDVDRPASERLQAAPRAYRAVDELSSRNKASLFELYNPNVDLDSFRYSTIPPTEMEFAEAIVRRDVQSVRYYLGIGVRAEFLLSEAFRADSARRNSNEFWISPLSYSIAKGYNELVEQFVGSPEVDVNFRCDLLNQTGNSRRSHRIRGATPLYFAAVANNVEAARLLLSRADLDFNAKINSATALHAAVSPEMVELLLSRAELDVNVMADEVGTPLMALVSKPDVLKALLRDSRVEVNKVGPYGTALHRSMGFAIENCASFEALMQDPRIDLNATDAGGNTVLHDLARTRYNSGNSYIPCPQQFRALILDRRTSLGLKNRNQETALDIARKDYNQGVYNFMREAIDERNGVKRPAPKPNPVPAPKPKQPKPRRGD